MHRQNTYSFISIFLIAVTLKGFLFNAFNIQQGNIITDEQIAQLKQGMSITQVKHLLGTPVLSQKPVEDRTHEATTALIEGEKDITKLEYVYFYQPHYSKHSVRKHIRLLFEDEKLIEFTVHKQ